uniref:Retrovirus-related Pol polyprotein from transposon TNT 1-94 n=1 Tax=Vitis vinifera TaxID=29760 RepID=A5B7T1_VITVI|nr:hypothetical protein VITISV_039609 [Vitis vinifera]
MSEASYVIGINIKRDKSQQILGLSQETYINKVLERFHMKDCSPGTTLIVKGDRFSLNQSPSNDLEKKEMKNIPYASTVGSLMYAQVCIRSDISYVVGMLGRHETMSWAIWLRSFISRLQVVDSISKPLRIYCNNSATVFLAKNNKSGSRSKYIDIKYLAIREHVKSNKVAIEHISIGLMITDPLTKGLPPKTYKENVEHMGLTSVL